MAKRGGMGSNKKGAVGGVTKGPISNTPFSGSVVGAKSAGGKR